MEITYNKFNLVSKKKSKLGSSEIMSQEHF